MGWEKELEKVGKQVQILFARNGTEKRELGRNLKGEHLIRFLDTK